MSRIRLWSSFFCDSDPRTPAVRKQRALRRKAGLYRLQHRARDLAAL